MCKLRPSILCLIIFLANHLPQAALAGLLTSETKLRADRLISVFENQSLDISYDYIDDLHDGRGFTAGRAGFCTACGDLFEVVTTYTAKAPANPLARYLPELKKLADSSDIRTTSLIGFESAWKKAAADSKFRAAQDDFVDAHLYLPAVELAQKFGLDTDFGIVAIYEAAVQHDFGDDGDSVVSMLKEAAGPKSNQVSLLRFLEVRRSHLLNPVNKETADTWRESVGRADEMIRLYSSGRSNFDGPIEVKPFGRLFVIP